MCSICYDIVIPGAAQTDEGRVLARILLVEVDLSHGEEEGLLPGLVRNEHTLLVNRVSARAFNSQQN